MMNGDSADIDGFPLDCYATIDLEDFTDASVLVYDSIVQNVFRDRISFNVDDSIIAICSPISTTESLNHESSSGVVLQLPISFGKITAKLWVTSDVLVIGFQSGEVIIFNEATSSLDEVQMLHNAPVQAMSLDTSYDDATLWILFADGYVVMVCLSYESLSRSMCDI